MNDRAINTPVAWAYELAHSIDNGVYGDWHPKLSEHKPNVPEGSIRNLRALVDAAPTTPAASWRVDGEPDPHGTHYDGERAALILGDLTDDELANGAFMNYDVRLSMDDMLNPKPGKHMPIVWMTAVKERIRWLSRALVNATGAEEISRLEFLLEDSKQHIGHLLAKAAVPSDAQFLAGLDAALKALGEFEKQVDAYTRKVAEKVAKP